MYSRMLDKQLEEWLAEDVGSGDLTSEALLPEGAVTAGIIHAKDTGILCGVEVARQVFRVLDPSLTFEALAKDGDKLEPGTLIAKVTGSARSVLTGERLALNLLQHLSGIATRTKKLADLAKPYGTRVVDTRKTTPGLRLLEKYAVRTGGLLQRRRQGVSIPQRLDHEGRRQRRLADHDYRPAATDLGGA